MNEILISNITKAGFMRLPEILQIIPVCKSYWWEGVKEGAFPKPIKLGRISMWRVDDINNLICKLSTGEGNE